jgi:hypothetical protein
LSLKRSDVLHEAIDVPIYSVVFVLVGHDLLLEDALLRLQLLPVLLQIINLPASGVVIQLQILGTFGEEVVILADTCSCLVESELLIEQFLAIGQETVQLVLELLDFDRPLI